MAHRTVVYFSLATFREYRFAVHASRKVRMLPPPSLDVAYDAIKGRIATQDAQIGALDGKANFGLA